MITLRVGLKGGPTSGNRGHAGRPGKIGGSVARGVGAVVPTPVVEPVPKKVLNGSEVLALVQAIGADYDKRIQEAQDAIYKNAGEHTTTQWETFAASRKAKKALEAERDAAIKAALKVDDPTTDFNVHVSSNDKEVNLYAGMAKAPIADANVAKALEATKFVSSITSKSVYHSPDSVYMEFIKAQGRSQYNLNDKTATLYGSGNSRMNNIATIVHEMGHHIEGSNPEVRAQARNYRASRTQFPAKNIAGYAKDERFLVANKNAPFIMPYMGKVYTSGATEMISVALESLYSKPAEFAKKDPGSFKFIINTLRGTSG